MNIFFPNNNSGYFHEHTRSDRDDYVNVDTNWINDLDATDGKKNSFRHQYKICTLRACQDLLVGYDYSSVMHYGGRTCITLRNGQRKCK